VIFFVPGTILFEDNYPSFHIFLNLSPPMTRCILRKYRYLGEYSKHPITSTTVEGEEWLGLPIECRTAWSLRIHSSKKRNIRAIHASIDIRNARPEGPPPSQDEIEEWLDNHPGRREGMMKGTLINAFNRGEEKINLALVRCIRYNIEVATKLQGMDGPTLDPTQHGP